MCTQAKANNFKAGESLSTLDPHVLPLSKGGIRIYDAVSDVVESGVQSRSNFQIGSRVLKICFKPILMHIYGIQCDFMHRSC